MCPAFRLRSPSMLRDKRSPARLGVLSQRRSSSIQIKLEREMMQTMMTICASDDDTTIVWLTSQSQVHTQNLCIIHMDVAISDTLRPCRNSNSGNNKGRKSGNTNLVQKNFPTKENLPTAFHHSLSDKNPGPLLELCPLNFHCMVKFNSLNLLNIVTLNFG